MSWALEIATLVTMWICFALLLYAIMELILGEPDED